MKTMRKMLIILMIITALTASVIPAYSKADQLTTQKTIRSEPSPVDTAPEQSTVRETTRAENRLIIANVIRNVRPVLSSDLSDLDESTIDEKVNEAVDAESTEQVTESTIWYLNANGYTTPIDPVTDAAQSRLPIRLQLIAEKVKITEFGVLYKVHWGRIIHNGARYEVEGYALLDGDGVFYMRLDGDIAFKAIGRIHRFMFGVRVVMKGYLVDGDTSYSHIMRGWAIPLNLRMMARLGNNAR